MSYWYLATPYSKYGEGLDAAFVLAARAAGELNAAGIPTFSPIAHGHPMSVHAGIPPLNHEFWLALDAAFMGPAHGLIVLMAEGWDKSFGIAKEIDAFKVAGKPAFYLEPGNDPETIYRLRYQTELFRAPAPVAADPGQLSFDVV